MEILIDDREYYFNYFTNTTKSYIDEIYDNLFLRYPKLHETLTQYFTSLKNKYTEFEQMDMLKKMICGIAKFLKDSNFASNEDRFYALIRKHLVKEIKFVLLNEKQISINKVFFYEPINVYSYFLLNSTAKRVFEYLSHVHGEDSYIILLLDNIVRSLKSSLLLYINGDDVHAVSLSRGIIEQYSRVKAINEENYDDFKEHILLNAKLQALKQKNVRLKDYPADLYDLIVNKNYRGARLESYLLNGWCKTKNGRPIANNTDLIKHSLDPIFLKYYQFASEFVHEDYIFVDYDYINIRKKGRNIIGKSTLSIIDALIPYIGELDSEQKQAYVFLSEFYDN